MFIEVDEDFHEHPKTVRLRTALQNSLAGYYVIRLWSWCTKYQKDGDLSSYQPEEVEAAVGWTLDAGKLYAALVAVGFITGAHVHDWDKHQGKWIKRLEAERQRSRDRREGRRREDREESSPTLHDLAEMDRQTELPAVAPATDVRPPVRPPVDQQLFATAKPSKADLSRAEQRSGSESAEVLSDSTPALLTFPVVGGKDGEETWPFTDSTLKHFEFSFPALDVLAEMRKALSWVECSPRNRKTARGMPAFIHRWLSRAQDRGGARSPNGAAPRDVRRGNAPPSANHTVGEVKL